MPSRPGPRALELLRDASFVARADHAVPGPGTRVLRERRARLILRSLQASILVQLALTVAKVAVGGAAEQPYVLAGALMNAGAMVAKVVILVGAGDDPRRGGHFRPYGRAGVVVLLTGLAYTACCVVAAVTGSFTGYTRVVAVVIATSAFVELGASLVGVLTTRRLWTPLIQANKLVNLAGGLVALALAQVAILSFTATSMEVATQTATANTLFTVLMGVGVIGVGTAMALHGRTRLQQLGGGAPGAGPEGS